MEACPSGTLVGSRSWSLQGEHVSTHVTHTPRARTEIEAVQVVGVAVALAAKHVQSVVVQHAGVEVTALGWCALDCDHLPLGLVCQARSVARDRTALTWCQSDG